MNKFFKTILYWLLLFVHMAFIFYLSCQSHPVPFFGNIEKYHLDWVFHSVEYLILGFLLAGSLCLSFESRLLRSPAALLTVTLILGSFYGMTDEWHQSFTPMRDPSVADWLADTIGVLIGAMIYS